MNFVTFRKFMILSLDFIKGEERETFIRSQWKLLRDGVRDVRIHDASCNAWTMSGGKV